MSTSGGGFGTATPGGPASGDLGGTYPSPSVTGLQGRPISATAPTNNQLLQWNGSLWVPASLVIPAAASSVTGPDAFGAAAVVGTSTAYARQDHDHGLPANPAPGPATTVTGPDAFGAGSVVGVSSLYARQDHDHGLPANPAPGFATPAVALGTAAAAGVAGTVIRSDSTVVAFDTTVPVTQASGDVAATGTAAVASRRDHKHGMPTLPAAASTVTGPDAFGAAAVVGSSTAYARQDHDHGLPAAPAAGAMVLIASQVLGSAAASVTFSSISGAYNHLRLFFVVRFSDAVTIEAVTAQFNGDTAANYDYSMAIWTGATPTANPTAAAAVPNAFLGYGPGSSDTAGSCGTGDVRIPLYAGTTFHKDVLTQFGSPDNGNTNTYMGAGASKWRSTAAINAIKILTPGAGNFVTGSAFYLYGIT